MKKYINSIWELPFFYKLLQSTLAGQGHKKIKEYLLANIPKKSKSILDQGCGTGEYSLLFGEKYTGIDNNRAYISKAQKIYPGKFIVGTATKMKLPSNNFDTVFAVGLHHHLTDQEAKNAFKEALRVTKKGGKLVVVDAMLPKNKLNIPGLMLRKMDRGGFVRKVAHTLKLIPAKVEYKHEVFSSYPFDYLGIIITKV